MQAPASLLPDRDRAELKIVLVYENMAAALWAADTLTRLFRKDSSMPELKLSPWSFGVLGDPARCGPAAADMAQADIIVLSTSSEMTQLPPPIESWLEQCLARARPAADLAVVAMFRRGDRYDGMTSPRLQTVHRLTRQAGCAFITPSAVEAAMSVA